MKKLLFYAVAAIFLVNMYGCFALFAGAAAGAGTALWLSDKLTQQVNAPYEQTIRATKSALESLKLAMTKETRDVNITQIKAKYTDDREIWIDIRPVTESSTRIDVRVGMTGDKVASDKILKQIARYL
jgi:hypothetical protein